MSERKTIDLEQGWDFMQKGITKLKNILEGLPEPQFSSEDYMMLYTTIYNMCTQKPPNDYSQPLYDKYKESFEEYIISTVYKEINGKVRDAVISLIDQEREGEQIDRALLKNVLDIFVEIGMGQMDHYDNDFEAAMLKDTAAYYSRKASNWILEDSCPDYMLKAEECLKREKDRVAHYLHSSSEPKLLEKVQHELLSVYANQLLEKEHSGCHALLRDDKVEDLSRMFRLFSKIPKGLDPVSSIFKQSMVQLHPSWKKLARRLLFDKSANDDHERSILTKLKQQCGGQFTSKMEGMVTDLTLAKENQTSFEEYLSNNPNVDPGIDLTVTIPLPPVDEKKKVIEDVDKDRRYAIDASIVRIMKSRKVLNYQQLVVECVEQLGRMFKPDVKAIKKRIEDLISRDYLERDKDNANLFKYLA
ncbi:hypothetical protein TSUD_102700 [Trifolium subterraneum]|uniref:Cullin family profile domain-containing protein n=1 Tax=Trifolium subterraneum TaxID=3900 RepID=A0A2Z6MZ42_TRISU|nr:hypothetical protein TSUD_102700 [Trifolium subterraneum]